MTQIRCLSCIILSYCLFYDDENAVCIYDSE